MPNIFSTSSSTGRPCVSHPALNSTRSPFIPRNLGMTSFMTRVLMCPKCGLPLAVGGPSYNVNEGVPSLAARIERFRISLAFQKARISFSRSTKFISVETFSYMLYPHLFKIALLCMQNPNINYRDLVRPMSTQTPLSSSLIDYCSCKKKSDASVAVF